MYVRMHAYVCMYVCMYAYMYVRMYVCIYIIRTQEEEEEVGFQAERAWTGRPFQPMSIQEALASWPWPWPWPPMNGYVYLYV